MLIVQIALGIVLAVVLLAFLPQIFSIGVWLAVVVLALVAAGVAIYFMFEYFEYIVAIFAAFIALALFFRQSNNLNLDDEKKRRKALGYED